MVANLLAGERGLDSAAVTERALRGVGGLDELGVGAGAVIAIMLRNDIAYFEAVLIARLAGCYTCPLNWHFKAEEAGFILRDCGAAVLIVHSDLLAQIAGGIPQGTRVIVVEPSAALRAAFHLEPPSPMRAARPASSRCAPRRTSWSGPAPPVA